MIISSVCMETMQGEFVHLYIRAASKLTKSMVPSTQRVHTDMQQELQTCSLMTFKCVCSNKHA
jgi:hypothetical protein